MKKRLISLILVLAMVASFSITAFATDSSSGVVPLSLNSTKLSLKVGESASLTASVMGCEAEVTWSSSNDSVATINSGTVTAASLGKAVITATTVDGLSASCAVHVALKGIDVSRYQYDINWNSVKDDGVDFAIIRTGYGHEDWANQTDPYFNANYDGATTNGIKVGVYHYSYATTVAAAAEEARMCLSILNGRKLDYPVFLDVEDPTQRVLSRELLTAITTTFCQAIQNAGYKAGVYSSPSIFNSNLINLDTQYDKWVAHWGVDSPRYNNAYTMWQYGSGPVAGINGSTDLDYSYVDYCSIGQPSTPGTPETPNIPTTLQCDTTSPYSFGSNNTYCYKITTPAGTAPVAASSNSAAVTVAYSAKTSGGYLYKITNVNAGMAMITTTAADGSAVSFMAYGKANGLVCDTTLPFTMKRGATYTFKFTPNGTAGVPKFTTGNGSVISPVQTSKIGGCYYIKIKANGRGCTGVYTTLPNQQSVRHCIVTVA